MHQKKQTKTQKFRLIYFWGKDTGTYRVKTDENQDPIRTVRILPGITPEMVAISRDGNDLVITNRETGEALIIDSHFNKNNLSKIRWLQFADGTLIDCSLNELLSNKDFCIDNSISLNLYKNGVLYNGTKIGKN